MVAEKYAYHVPNLKDKDDVIANIKNLLVHFSKFSDFPNLSVALSAICPFVHTEDLKI